MAQIEVMMGVIRTDSGEAQLQACEWFTHLANEVELGPALVSNQP
jgi:hypothetical protein